MVDYEGYLSFFKGVNMNGLQATLPGMRIFYGDKASVYTNEDKAENELGGPLRLNNGESGSSGRRKFSLVDWDNDVDMDLQINSLNVTHFENINQNSEQVIFMHKGPLSEKVLAGHTTSPSFVDWKKDGVWEIFVGAEDGHFYHFQR